MHGPPKICRRRRRNTWSLVSGEPSFGAKCLLLLSKMLRYSVMRLHKQIKKIDDELSVCYVERTFFLAEPFFVACELRYFEGGGIQCRGIEMRKRERHTLHSGSHSALRCVPNNSIAGCTHSQLVPRHILDATFWH